MLLFSSTFFLFLLVVFLAYWPAARTRLGALAVLLFANYYFVTKWDLLYLFLIPLASAADYWIARGIPKYRHLLWVSIVLNIGLILSFKFGLLVLGLSFYAFQSLSYTIDVYRGDAKPASSFLAYLTAVAFFPTILAGPITRPSNLMPQLEKRAVLDDTGRAFFLIGLGLVKKLLIADFLADNLVNRVFDLPSLYSGFEVLIGVYGYAFQLYYDFSGYTDIAIGSAMLLGIKLPVNFNRPYAAENVADFWRRWHISLSNWLRDYVYFSLPGARSKWKPHLNLMITMLVGGLWHGIGWTFLVWGALHGAGLVIHRLWPHSSRLATFHFVCFAWIFFRASSLEAAGNVLGRIGSFTFSVANLTPTFLFVLAVATLAHYTPKTWYEAGLRFYTRVPFYVQAAALALVVLGIENVANTGAAPFVYTRF